MQFSTIIIYTFINTILAKGRDDPANQNDDRLSQISSVDDNQTHHQNDDSLPPQISSSPSSYPSNDSSSNSSSKSSYINYLALLQLPMIMFL